VTNEFGSSLVPWQHNRLTHRDGYMCTMPSGYEHSLVWTLLPQHRWGLELTVCDYVWYCGSNTCGVDRFL